MDIASLPDPTDTITYVRATQNNLDLYYYHASSPAIGVLLVIFEASPEVIIKHRCACWWVYSPASINPPSPFPSRSSLAFQVT
jgi:gamma-glutamyl phosphate reductase